MADKLSVADKPSVASGSKAMPIDSEAMSALIKAQKIIQNLDLRYNGENGAVTQKEASDSVAELTGAAVIARGSYIPAGRKPNPSERKLYLLRQFTLLLCDKSRLIDARAIEGSTQASVIEAKRELQRILDENTLQVGLGGDKYAKYSL
ncbi:hypothetical protein PsorP6_008485 [Peronosclerospora sorghi]|uniref:Uncharacterized protein n=1 Tax=Peronosclerospora sorghi TaxID=230839 RepID=A0ACC0W8E1_9STRA|nr:hypothetical protein PsorP6_008485 [Peronosclerospora sorghi]